ncbi:hypothetical protein BST17_08505 [Mycolicibacterium bacteremicum]|uniref:HNH nuclease domain-containing protein n=1 Tax=Mycolicibacterium bacteremicum TaxID=564198 RepID=A0A1W9Z0J0_MYCBA|nr:hypothetical protein BST17_08505 [Mycolicibacterium bacteremicum]
MPDGLSDDECWPWQGALGGRKRDGRGYGKFTINGKQYDAHRVSWELHNGQPVPTGLQVMHACDNPKCVNPLHLTVGTNRDNVDDMVSKWRQTYGVRNPRAVLNEDAVAEIRRLGPSHVNELAVKYGVTHDAIRFVLRRTTWKHLP